MLVSPRKNVSGIWQILRFFCFGKFNILVRQILCCVLANLIIWYDKFNVFIMADKLLTDDYPQLIPLYTGI